MPDPTLPDAPPPDERYITPTTNNKAWWAAWISGGLSALVTAVMVTSSTAGNEIHVVWDQLWCDSTMTEGPYMCQPFTTRWAIKVIIEVFLDQWWRAIVSAGITGTVVGRTVYNVKNVAK